MPTICKMANHPREAVERCISDFEAVRMLYPKFMDADVINRIIPLSKLVVKQYADLIPLKGEFSHALNII